MKSTLLLVTLIALATAACLRTKDLPLEYPTPQPPAAATPLGKIELKRDAQLETGFARIAEAAKGTVGVAAVVIETGEAALLNADGRFPMQSVYKLPIAMAVMEQVRLGKLDLEEKIGVTREDFVRPGMRSPLRDQNPNGGEFTIRELIRLALVESDGTASDVLMRTAGGAAEIQSFLTQIGIDDMKVVNTEKEIGRDWETQYENWSTPLASVELLRWLYAAASSEADPAAGETNENVLTIRFMADSLPGAKRLKGMLPAGTFVAHKTGTGGTKNGITGATNDIGLVVLPDGRHIAIAVFVSDSSGDEGSREAVIARIARAVWDQYSGTRLANGKKIRCAQPRSEDEEILCAEVLPKAYRDDVTSFEAFELTSREVDLNRDGRAEVVAWESSWAGTSGGALWVLERAGTKYRTIFNADATWSPIGVLDSRSEGWADLSYLVTGGGVESHFVRVSRRAGSYRNRASAGPDQPNGEIIIDRNWHPSAFGPIPNP